MTEPVRARWSRCERSETSCRGPGARRAQHARLVRLVDREPAGICLVCLLRAARPGPSRCHGLRRSLARRVAGDVVSGCGPRRRHASFYAPRAVRAVGRPCLLAVSPCCLSWCRWGLATGMQLGTTPSVRRAKQDEAASRPRSARPGACAGSVACRGGCGLGATKAERHRRHGEPATRVRRGREPSAGRGAWTRHGQAPVAASSRRRAHRRRTSFRPSTSPGLRLALRDAPRPASWPGLARVLRLAGPRPGDRVRWPSTFAASHARCARTSLPAGPARGEPATRVRRAGHHRPGSRGSLALAPHQRAGPHAASQRLAGFVPAIDVTGSRNSLPLPPPPASGPARPPAVAGPRTGGPGPFVVAGGAAQGRAWVRRNPRPCWRARSCSAR